MYWENMDNFYKYVFQSFTMPKNFFKPISHFWWFIDMNELRNQTQHKQAKNIKILETCQIKIQFLKLFKAKLPEADSNPVPSHSRDYVWERRDWNCKDRLRKDPRFFAASLQTCSGSARTGGRRWTYWLEVIFKIFILWISQFVLRHFNEISFKNA